MARLLTRTHFASLLAPLLGSLPLLASAAGPVPPGFEMLLEEQTNAVDVYYGNQFLVSTIATFDPNEIEFENPAQILERVPDLLDEADLLAALSGRLATHSELVCLREEQVNCGTLHPDRVDLIFDETRFRVDLFINPRFLALRNLEISRYLPPSDAGLGFLQTFTAAFSGGDEQDHVAYSVNGGSTISLGEKRLATVSNYTDGGGFKLDTIALQREFAGRQWNLGLFRSQAINLTFLAQRDLLGVRLASSLDTMADLDQSEGNEITLYLPARSRVDLYREGRLYSSRIYDLGNQVLDTSDLPSGAYDVTLVIRDDFGNRTEETRFYVKSSRLPPLGQRLYFLDAGEVRERKPNGRTPAGTGLHLLRAGLSQRAGDHVALNVGTEISEEESLLEAGTAYLSRRGEFDAGAAITSDGNYAVLGNARARIGSAAIDGTYRKSWVTGSGTESLIGNELEQATLNLALPLGPGRLEFHLSRNDRGRGLTDNTYAASYEFNEWRFGRQQARLSVELARDQDDLQLIGTFEWRWREKEWGAAITPRYQKTRPAHGSSTSDLETSAIVNWDRVSPERELHMTLRDVDSRGHQSLEYDLTHESNLGAAQINIDSTERAGNRTLSYGGTLSASLVADPQGTAIGGRDQSQSALIVEIEGEAGEGYFEVMIDGASAGVAHPGKRTLFSLRPFQTYEVYLRDRGTAYLQFDDQVRRVTLYPGNVHTLRWKVSEVIVVFGRLVRPDGSPVASALLRNLPGLATTDEDGSFQAQMPADLPTIEARTHQYQCSAPVGGLRMRRNIGLLGTLVCE